MPFDFKKEYKEFYLPKAKPEIVTVPRANYIAVRGRVTQMRRVARISAPSASSMPWPIRSK